MELFRNIFFNTDKIVENTVIKVTYAGKLFQNGSQEVIVHYGFGENWENAQDIKMQKSELGFQADIYVQPGTKLNFCFKNSTGEWDNNNNSNYEFTIEKTNWQEKNNNTQNIENNWKEGTKNTNYINETNWTTGTNYETGTNNITDVNYTMGTGYTKDIKNATGTNWTNNSDYAVSTNNTQKTNTSLCKTTSTWGELIKKTFDNFVKCITKLFSGNKEKVNN